MPELESKGAKALYQMLSQPRITPEDKEILSWVFEDHYEVLLAVRNLFFGFELDNNEQGIIKKSFESPEIRKLMRKIFFPEILKEIVIGQNIDMWMFKDMNEATPETFEHFYKIKSLMLEMMEASLARLENIDLPAVELAPKKDLVFLMARNSYIGFVDAQLKVLATQSIKESPEEAVARMKKNSNK